MKSVTVEHMIKILEDSISARQAKYGKDAAPPNGPLITFLVGAGFSVTAGLSSVNHLVVALELFRKDRSKSWFDVFDSTLEVSLNESGITGPELTDYYFNLMGEVLPLPQSRHDFITAAIQWASERRVQMNIEGILLANLMIAGTGGNSSFHPRRKKRHWMAKAFTRHVFTTNFDEVLPNTFYFGNQPVEIIDTPGRHIHSASEYPTVVYLHGRHLHYDLRNTRTELHSKKSSSNSDQEDLFTSFRKLLRHTGLVVIGYAGAKDKVTQTIIEALEDGNSLPYGLWWSAYRDENAIDPDVRKAISQHERAFVLDPGKDAEQIMRSISQGTGLDEVKAIERWTNRLVTVNSAVNKFLVRASYDFRRFNMNAVEALLFGDEESMTTVAEEWNIVKDHVLDHTDKYFVADILENVAKILVAVGDRKESEEVFEELYNLIENMGNNDKLAKFSLSYGKFRILTGNVKKAADNFKTALKYFKQQESHLGEAQALIALSNIDLLRNNITAASKKINEAENICKKANYTLGIGDTLALQGVIASFQDKYDEALKLVESAIETHKEDGSETEILKDLRSLGYINLSKGEYSKAKEFFEESLKKSEMLNQKREIAHAHKALSEIHFSLGDQKNTEKHLDLSKKGFKDHFDARGTIQLEILSIKNQFKLNNTTRDVYQTNLLNLKAESEAQGFLGLSDKIENLIKN
ncbi:MAG: SIR2 family protein [Methylococcales bacterium]|nr:SIR2 family protein [Methylococcales bacterium]